MTNSLLTPTRLVPDSELFSLCKILSHERYQPTAIQVLYFLLQPIIQNSIQHPEDVGAALTRSHGDSIQVMTFGDIPSLAELEEGEDAEVLEKVWGLAILWTFEAENTTSVRGRFWISSEKHTTPASSPTSTPGIEGKRWQPDAQSIHLLHTMCDTFFRPFLAAQQEQTGSPSSIFFNGTNQCWTPILATLGMKTYDGLCTKAARAIPLDGSSAEDVICPAGFRMRKLEEKDIQTVVDSNKIKFPPSYVRSRAYLSVAIVNSQTDELASWAMTHADFSVGALHTAPTYRRLGLGSIVVAQLANIVRTHLAANPLTSQLLRNSGGDGHKFRMHAECQAFNSVAMDWFCGLGYEKVVDNTWVMIEF